MGGCFSSPQTGSQAGPQPAQASASRASDPVSQALGDAQQAVGLYDGIYKIVKPAVLSAMNKRDETKALKKVLGLWWDEAFQYGACMVPVLDIEHFETHLKKTNGFVKPHGNCTAISPWGWLLHALAINPGDRILTWKPANGACWDMLEGTLAMDVRGTAFCHLVNLYKIEDPTEEGIVIEGRHQRHWRCRLSFGWLTWTSTDVGHMTAKFEPDTILKINGPKQPLLGSFGEMLGDTLWTSYQAALRHGISDPEMAWPDPNTTSLSERLQYLVTNMNKIKDPGDDKPDSSGLLVTRKWLEHATRIKRRATTDGGNNDAFLKDAYKALAQHPKRPKLNEFYYTIAQHTLQECFFFAGDQFSLYQPGDELSSELSSTISPYEVIQATLESYISEDPNSWKGILYASKENVAAIACMRPRIIAAPGEAGIGGYARLLDFAPGDALWGARVHL